MDKKAKDILNEALGDAFGDEAQPGVRRTTIGEMLELLPPQVVENDVMPLLNSSLDDSECRKRLSAVLNRFAADLEAGGILPDYLAWALIYARQQQRGPT